ncbi:putative gustatory receptor 93c [Drosophila willistoni]|uniref:putative gustatory receptor 93c n=1 Tax=Drosophila willistoni TaxID=7260 RepID=UPI000C26C662|nr:putative gustatory receptor 93c [Drosophila willistoni]
MIMQYFHGQDLIRLVQRFFKIFQRVGELKRPKQMGYGGNRELFLLLLEMFLNRLNFYRFRVRLLGLFEVSNEFLRLFRRVRGLSERGKDKTGFGGVRELVLLLIKTFCIFHELVCEWPMLFHSSDLLTFSSVLCEIFVGLGAGMVMHSCFVGFLSLGALFADFNSYVRHDLRRQLRALERPHDACPNRRHLRAMGFRLDECFAVYDEIQSVGREFNRLINVPLVLSVLVNFSVMAMVSFHAIMFSRTIVSYIWLVVAKLFLDIAILTIAVHGAVSSSRQIRRLGLENCYVSEHNEWHLKMIP